MRRLALAVSLVLQPSLVAAALYIASAKIMGEWLGLPLALMFSSFLPLAFAISWARLNGAPWDLPSRGLRGTPLLFASASNLVGAFVVYFLSSARYVSAIMTGYGIGGLMAYVASKRWKVSIHALGVAEAVVGFYYLAGAPLTLMAGLATLMVGWARVKLGKHTVLQVAMGTVLGALSAFTAFRIFLA